MNLGSGDSNEKASSCNCPCNYPRYWLAISQSGIISTTLTGNEVAVFALGGPGGPSIFVPVSELRNAQGISVIAATSGAIQIDNKIASLVTGAQVTGALTVSSPAIPLDGEIFELVNGSSATNTAIVTYTATNASQTVLSGAVSNQVGNTSTEWRYSQASATWFRLR